MSKRDDLARYSPIIVERPPSLITALERSVLEISFLTSLIRMSLVGLYDTLTSPRITITMLESTVRDLPIAGGDVIEVGGGGE